MKKILALSFLSLIVAACAPSTPEARIQKNPGKFGALSAKEKALVLKGEIARGMTKEAVLLAWGDPAQRFDGYQNAKKVERWDYTISRAVPASHYGFGYGYGRAGRYRDSGLGVTTGHDFVSVPRHVGSVWFVKERVDSWNRAR